MVTSLVDNEIWMKSIMTEKILQILRENKKLNVNQMQIFKLFAAILMVFQIGKGPVFGPGVRVGRWTIILSEYLEKRWKEMDVH